MPATYHPTIKTPPVVVTPPMGAPRVDAGKRTASKRRSRKNFWSLVRAEPTRLHLVGAAAIYWLVPWMLSELQGVALAHDGLFSAVVYLMWSGSPEAARRMAPL